MVPTIIRSYPESSPFELQFYPVFNLLPSPETGEEYDTDAVRQAALSIAVTRSGHNIFAKMYGSNPLPVVDRALLEVDMPFLAFNKPVDARRIALSPSAQF